jgi:hypothetical protein
MRGQPKQPRGRGLASQPSGENGLCSPRQRAHAAHAPARSPRADRVWNSIVACSPAARWWQGLAGDLEGATGEVLGKEERAGAHRNGVPMVRRRKRRRAAVFNDGGVAPVVVDKGGWVL